MPWTRLRNVATTVAMGFLCPWAQGASTWLGPNSNAVWSAAGSWVGGQVPANNGTADIILNQNVTTSGFSRVDQNWSVRSVTLTGTYLSSFFLSAPVGADEVVLSVGGGGVTSNSALSSGSFADLDITGVVINLAANQTWDARGPIKVFNAGRITGPGSLTKTGAAVLDLGLGTNDFSGGLLIKGGMVVAGSDSALGTGGIAIDGGALLFDRGGTFTRDIAVAAGGAEIAGSGVFGVEYTGGLSGAGHVRFSSGQLTLTGNHSYAGATRVEGLVTLAPSASLGRGNVTVSGSGILNLNAAANLKAGSKVTLETGGALGLRSTAFDPAALLSAASAENGMVAIDTLDYTRALDMGALGGGGLALTGGPAGGRYTGPTLDVGARNVYRLGGLGDLAIGGHDDLLTGTASVQVGTAARPFNKSVVTLENANNYSGGTQIFATTLAIKHNAALGSGPVEVGRDATLSLAGATSVANSIINDGTLRNENASAVILTGNVVNTGTVRSDGRRITFAGSVRGRGIYAGGGEQGDYRATGTFSAGDGVGRSTIQAARFELAGTFVWDLRSLTGVAGEQWDLLVLDGNSGNFPASLVLGGTLRIQLNGLAFDGTADFWRQAHTFEFVSLGHHQTELTGAFAGLENNVFQDAAGTGVFGVRDNTITYAFTPVPEPGATALLAVAALMGAALAVGRRARGLPVSGSRRS
jgi:hypothetical protein